jgi:hypothetical protein
LGVAPRRRTRLLVVLQRFSSRPARLADSAGIMPAFTDAGFNVNFVPAARVWITCPGCGERLMVDDGCTVRLIDTNGSMWPDSTCIRIDRVAHRDHKK